MQTSSLKIHFKTQTQFISKVPSNLNDFISNVENLFQNELPSYWCIQYKDQDDDLIMVINSRDFNGMIKDLKESIEPLEVYIVQRSEGSRFLNKPIVNKELSEDSECRSMESFDVVEDDNDNQSRNKNQIIDLGSDSEEVIEPDGNDMRKKDSSSSNEDFDEIVDRNESLQSKVSELPPVIQNNIKDFVYSPAKSIQEIELSGQTNYEENSPISFVENDDKNSENSQRDIQDKRTQSNKYNLENEYRAFQIDDNDIIDDEIEQVVPYNNYSPLKNVPCLSSDFVTLEPQSPNEPQDWLGDQRLKEEEMRLLNSEISSPGCFILEAGKVDIKEFEASNASNNVSKLVLLAKSSLNTKSSSSVSKDSLKARLNFARLVKSYVEFRSKDHKEDVTKDDIEQSSNNSLSDDTMANRLKLDRLVQNYRERSNKNKQEIIKEEIKARSENKTDADILSARLKFIRLIKAYAEASKKKKEELQAQKTQKLEKPRHEECYCDGCRMWPIVGVRYRCSVCEDFDFCENCEATKDHSHLFLKIKDPKEYSKLEQNKGHFLGDLATEFSFQDLGKKLKESTLVKVLYHTYGQIPSHAKQAVTRMFNNTKSDLKNVYDDDQSIYNSETDNKGDKKLRRRSIDYQSEIWS